ESIPWIDSNLTMIDALREAEQPGAIQLAVCSSVPRAAALAVIGHVLRHGKAAGRLAAAKALGQFHEPEASELTVQLLDDEDPQVRACGALQLRDRKAPGAIQRLMVLLDSPHEV